MTINPRYLAYCRDQGGHPDTVGARDEELYPGFIIWIGQQWCAWAKQRPGGMPDIKTDAHHAEFDAWLQESSARVKVQGDYRGRAWLVCGEMQIEIGVSTPLHMAQLGSIIPDRKDADGAVWYRWSFGYREQLARSLEKATIDFLVSPAATIPDMRAALELLERMRSR